MAFRIEETFHVRAPVDRVWRYLVDPRQVVECLPGAELTEQQDERTYVGRVKVKVGPITAAYSGRATIVEQDDAAHVVRLTAEGRETGGSGSARMSMTSRLTTRPDGATEVHVTADVDVVGKVVQFGRGMIESVNKQLFRQFTDCMRAQLEGAEAGPGAATSPPGPDLSTGAAAGTAPVEAVVAPTAAAGVHAPARAVGEPARPLKLLPLLFRALWERIARLWRRPQRV